MFLSFIDSTDPIDLLVSEQDVVQRQLLKLDVAVNNIRKDGYSQIEFGRLVESVRSLSSLVLQHNRKEEKFLFPLLNRHINGSLYRMKQEHRELVNTFDKLVQCAQRIGEGNSGARSVDDLVQTGLEIIDLLGEHFAHEGKMVFPLAKQVLSLDEYEQFKEGIVSSAIHDGSAVS